MDWSTIGIILIVILVIVAYFSPTIARKNAVTAEGPFSLETRTTLTTADQSEPLYSEPASSFSAFIYLSPMNRTGAHAECGTNPNQASCADGTFAPCACEVATKDCSICAHAGYKTVINISGVFVLEVLNAPDAGRNKKALAQLLIKTEGAPVSASSSGSQKYIETLILPPIPIQKWMMITIAREGRRFDVYYNESIVHSQKAMYMPVTDKTNSNSQGVTSGSEGLVGKVAMANIYNYRLSSPEISRIYKELSDTRGSPFIGSTANPLNTSDPSGLNPGFKSGMTLSSFLPSVSSIFCTTGDCLKPPVIRPASPLHDWDSSYA